METLFDQFGILLTQNIWISIIVALFAGIISSFTPCSLSSIPLIIGYVGGYSDTNKKKPLIYSLIFALGTSITFTVLGIISSTIGSIFLGIGSLWYIILGLIMLFVSLQMFGIIKIGSDFCKFTKNKKGIMGAFLLGILGGIFSSPCCTPVLIAILAFVAEKGNVFLGALILFVYSIGHSALIIISGTSVGFIQSILNSNRTNKIATVIKYIFSTLILILGLYMFYLGF